MKRIATMSLAAAFVAFAGGNAFAITANEALAQCRAANPQIPAAEITVKKEGAGYRCTRDLPVTGQQTPPPPSPPASSVDAPRVLVVDGRDVKVWGVSASQHFTVNNLFPNFWGKCPTGLVKAEEVTNPVILAKYKNPNVDHLYHFICLDAPLS